MARAPAKPSSASRCAPDCSSRCWSDCPCTATSASANEARVAAGTEVPPANARERPSADTCRVSSTRSSSTTPPASSMPDRALVAAGVGSVLRLTTPSTRAALAPVRTAPESARPPSSSPRAVTIIVFPAPVSPVIAVNPGPRSRTDSSITPSETIRSSSSIGVPVVPPAPLRRSPPTAHGELELRDQPVGERRLVEPHQTDRTTTATDLDPGSAREVDGAPAVAPKDADALVAADHLDGQHGGRRDDERAREQRVRTDRHHQQRLDTRPDDRAAGTEVVGRRPGGGRTHHAVTGPPRQRPAVDLDDHLDHPLPGGLLDARLVERPGGGHQLLVAVNGHVEGQPLLGDVAPPHHRVDREVDVVALGLREEADVTEVHAEQRGSGVVSELGRAQDGAVATDHHGQLTAGGGAPVGGDHLEVLDVQLQVGCLPGEQPDTESVLGESGAELLGDLAALGAPGVRDHEDPPHVCCWLAHDVTLSPGAPNRPVRRTSPAISASPTRATPRRSQRKYSTLPDGPGNGEVVTARAPQPRVAAASATPHTAAVRRSRSRTTPPLPTRSLPTSNWGLTIRQRSPCASTTASSASRTSPNEMNERSPTTTSTGPPTSVGVNARIFVRSWTTTRGSCCSDQASWP